MNAFNEAWELDSMLIVWDQEIESELKQAANSKGSKLNHCGGSEHLIELNTSSFIPSRKNSYGKGGKGGAESVRLHCFSTYFPPAETLPKHAQNPHSYNPTVIGKAITTAAVQSRVSEVEERKPTMRAKRPRTQQQKPSLPLPPGGE